MKFFITSAVSVFIEGAECDRLFTTFTGRQEDGERRQVLMSTETSDSNKKRGYATRRALPREDAQMSLPFNPERSARPTSYMLQVDSDGFTQERLSSKLALFAWNQMMKSIPKQAYGAMDLEPIIDNNYQ